MASKTYYPTWATTDNHETIQLLFSARAFQESYRTNAIVTLQWAGGDGGGAPGGAPGFMAGLGVPQDSDPAINLYQNAAAGPGFIDITGVVTTYTYGQLVAGITISTVGISTNLTSAQGVFAVEGLAVEGIYRPEDALLNIDASLIITPAPPLVGTSGYRRGHFS